MGDLELLHMPYARLMQRLRLNEELRAKELEEARISQSLAMFELYAGMQGGLTYKNYEAAIRHVPSDESPKRDPEKSLLTPLEWLQYHGHIPRPVRTLEEDYADAERNFRMVRKAFAKFGSRSVDVDDVAS
jgi:hypothetical protein